MVQRAMRALAIVTVACGSPLMETASVAASVAVALDSNSPTALVVVKGTWWRPAGGMQSAYKLVLSAYDSTQGKILGGPFGGTVLFEAKKKNFTDGYIVVPIKPGRWVFQSHSQQDKWALCFNAESRTFEVKAGEVVYLGELDAEGERDRLIGEAQRNHKLSMNRYSFADFFDLPEGPRLAPIDDRQTDAVRAMLKVSAPQVTAPVRAAEYARATFGTGSTLFAERKCGGYFAVAAKDKGTKAE